MSELENTTVSMPLDCSVDSGICLELKKENLKKKMQEFKRILFILERDKEAKRLLRERLGRIAERRSPKKKKDEQQLCNICLTPLDVDDPKAYITCCSCAKLVCSDEKCFGYEPKDGELRCRLCRAKRDSYGKTSSWVEEQSSVQKASPAYAYPMRARSEIYIPLCDPNDSAFLCNFESVSEAPSSINVSQKQQIRECIEEILAEMLGGPLDRTSVRPISRSEHYTLATTNGNGNDLQGVSHVRLRRLIESIIAETIRSPPFLPSGTVTTDATTETNGRLPDPDELILNGTHCNGNAGQYFAPKKYQDLLATAVLNRIVDTHGNGRHSESSPDLTNTSAFDKNHNDLFPNKTDESISSGSSVEPRSDSSLTEPLHNINKGDDASSLGSCRNFNADVENDNVECDNESVLSDFLASHMVPLPHITAEQVSEEEEEDEDFISVTSSGRDSNWEDNWFFKKKKTGKKGSNIGMLVPAPKEDIRALIGDKPTDEISDLSEIGSDTDDSSLEMTSAHLEPLNDRLVNQHLIGGKNTKVILDELADRSSLISTSSLPENVAPYTETKNDFVINDNGLNDTDSPKISLNNCNFTVSNEAINSNVTKTIPTEHKEEPNVPSPPPSDPIEDEKMRYVMANKNQDKTDSGDENSSSMSPRSSVSGPLSGSIAEREYKKWYNAVDMPNNPYSVEALKRRISGGPEKVIDLPSISPSTEEKPVILGQVENNDNSQDRDYARYSRDYYINDAKRANGGSVKNSTPSTTPSTERPMSSPIAPPQQQPTPLNESINTSPVESDELLEEAVEMRNVSPVKAMCHKLERQCRGESETGIYTATPARVEEDAVQGAPVMDNIHPLTTEAVSKLSSDSGSGPTTESLTPSEDSDTIRIYDLKKQETRLIKDQSQPTVPKTPTKKSRPTELEITPVVVASTSKCTTPSSFKFLQPKRKLIDPSQVLSGDLDTAPVTPSTTEKSVIEEDVVQSLPSVKALAQAFLLTSNTRTVTDKWHKGRTKSTIPTPITPRAAFPTPTTPAPIVIQRSPEPALADTTSQGSEDATIASDLSSLETDPPSKLDVNTSESTATGGKPLSPKVTRGCLRNNIAFFENLKNK